MKTLYSPTQKQIYFWNICGSMLNALLSVLLLLVVSNLLNDQKTDIFSLAWSFGMQAMTVGTFQARLYQATDTQEKYSLSQYFFFRVVTVVAMLLFSAGYVIISRFSFYKAAVIFFVCLAKSIDAFSDLFQGWFQQKERLDLAGKAFSAHSLALLFTLTPFLLITKDLLLSCIVMSAGNLIAFFLFDYRYFLMARLQFNVTADNPSKRFFAGIFISCLPLFANAYIIMDIFNRPKFLIDSAISSGLLIDGSQKIFSILFLPASVLNLIFFMFRPLITKLALSWNAGDKKTFFKIIRTLFLWLISLSVLVLAAGWFLGCPVLSIIYNTPLSQYRTVLMIAIIGGLFNTFMYVLDNVITVIRCHFYLIIAYAVTWIYTLLTSGAFVNNFGLLGAAICFATSMIILFLLTLIIFIICINSKRISRKITLRG